jgi:hypothetical protein
MAIMSGYRDKFIVAVLSDTSLLLKKGKEDIVREKVAEWQRSNTYESTDFRAG